MRDLGGHCMRGVHLHIYLAVKSVGGLLVNLLGIKKYVCSYIGVDERGMRSKMEM